MGGHVDLRFVGLRWEREPPRVQSWLETPLRRWILYRSVFSWLKADIKATLIDGGDL